IIFVVIFSAGLLKESPSRIQMLFILLGLVGIFFYFYPIDLGYIEIFGVLVVFVGMLANALSSVMGRGLNRSRDVPPVLITGISMTIGAVFLLALGLILEGIPSVISPLTIFAILWLGIVNTAIAFTLWNKSMQNLRAVDSTLINSTMNPQIVILCIIFLGEMPTMLDWVGLILLFLSVLFVQVSQAKKRETSQST
ncbi:MAG: DMT family transporter, partial [Candidatus Hodarchaeota archaeon]